MNRVQALRERWWWRLPRDARDTLFVLATIAAVLAPQLGHLPLWCSVFAASVLVWRGQLALSGKPLPSRVVLLAALVLVVVLTLNSHGRLTGREAGVTLLAALLALKTLELRARRDALVVFHLGFFLLLMQFLHGQGMAAALWSLVTCWALLTALVLAQMPMGRPALRVAATQAARVTLLGLPLMVALFVLFPRLGPLWGQPGEAVGRVGLSDEMSFGDMSELAEDDGIALRLRIEAGQVPPGQLYLRGPVLTVLAADGRSWLPPPPPPDAEFTAAAAPPQPRGALVRYTALIEPSRLRTLPLLDPGDEPAGTLLVDGDLRARRLPTLNWQTRTPLTQQVRLAHQTHLATRHDVGAATPEAAAALTLPIGRNPRLVSWAQSLAAGLGPGASAQARSQAVLAHLNGGDYLYTLSPGAYPGEHAVDDFWFDRKLGFCEHYAAGYVIALRAMGVPARVVTGYQGADAERQDGWLVVRNRQAHAWAEIWSPGAGWQRVDPTAAVAPNRVALGLPLPATQNALARALLGEGGGLLRTLQGWSETLDLRWQQWVLNYSRSQQMGLLERLGWREPDAAALGQLIAILIGATLAVASALLLWRARRLNRDEADHRWLQARLAAHGLPAQAHEAPLRWAALVQAQLGPAGEPLRALLLAEEARRYGPAAATAPRSAWARWRWRRAVARVLPMAG